MKLNLGCWHYPLPGFLNVDINPKYGLEHWDVTEPPYVEGEIEEIYAGHLVEHLTPKTADKALANWYKVLKPGGKLTLAFPNMTKSFAMYEAGELTLDEFNAILFGEVEEGYEPNTHKQLTDTDIVMQLCAEHGFTVTELARSAYAVAHPKWQSIVEAVK